MTWIVFCIVIAGLLIYDLGFANKENKVLTFRQTIYFSLFYLIIACLFGVFIFFDMGREKAQEYYTCFFIEKAMSLDNIFIILMIFQFFSIPLIYQHRILFLGILGVIVSRAIIIYLGVIVISKFSWLLYVFAIILIITGIKTFYLSNKNLKVQESSIYRILQKYFSITPKILGYKFFVKTSKGISITPLFASLIMIEVMDIVFAIDSIPAIFAITKDPYIIYTSNIFAILGLRALFLCLANVVKQFSYIKYSLALILIFIGIKIFAEHVIDIPSYTTLAMTIILLSFGIIISIIKKRRI
ncbi:MULTISPECIES: TerC/Alx family metal homeostasis membrane protein [unclassified Candidatus Tisiphia]|uniref:TerC/Alx family metal homeostasis membrane protein n=1 Tax=unclassified Candidatus Tisiphia TaxID=2996318 RepID=UPI001D6E3FBE|nr:TerC/Alx family metal homeostasis membrane protein [Rickettsia endosymbiont of Sericostoma sp. HW-2014]